MSKKRNVGERTSRKQERYKGNNSHLIVIGIDQSYGDSGITVAIDGVPIQVKSIKGKSKESHTLYRLRLQKSLSKLLKRTVEKSTEFPFYKTICIIERIRLQSAKPGQNSTHFLNLPYIKGIGALNATIVDTAYQFGIPVYSVDTRSWKSQVVGSSKPQSNKHGFPSEKWPTIQWCINQGYQRFIVENVSPKKQKCVIEHGGKRFTYNDNKADSIGIAMYGFLPKSKQKLQLEQ